MIEYFTLGPGKKLNEIVMAGSHDAGVTSGKSNVKTQSVDIGGQARAGVRVFDIRITASGSGKLRAYHGQGYKTTVQKPNSTEAIESKKILVGAYGLGLVDMLSQAKTFVRDHGNEFLILKFDKCQNWLDIADACNDILGGDGIEDRIYRVRGDLNNATLDDVKGKVIVCFTEGGTKALGAAYMFDHDHIRLITNLYGSNRGYDSSFFDGIQYWGKGGTSVAPKIKFWTDSNAGKIKQNIDKQKKIMLAAVERGAGADPEVMGMMYWTTTGITGNIKDRNRLMWRGRNVNKLHELWHSGFQESIRSRMPDHLDMDEYASAVIVKAFMPNIVMIDFADEDKCKKIFAMNKCPTTVLTTLSFGADEI